MQNNKNKTNLIHKLMDTEHPLSEIIKINPDGKSFINFENKSKVIICDDGSVMLEEIAREILMQTFLKDEKKIYSTENYHNGDYRSDLIAKIEKDISSVIEVKETNNINELSLNKRIDGSLNQVKNLYVKGLTKDCFVSIFVMNLELIIENSDLITRYFNLHPSERNNKFETFSKYGIYIETRRYNHVNETFSKDYWPNLAKHGEFSIRNSDLSIDGLKLKKIYCKIQNAINLPTSSTNSYGIKNVRNIKDPNISKEKGDLINSIIKTALISFNLQNPSIITSAGKDKDFLVSEDETLFYIEDYKEFQHLTLCTLNGAIIDGQNSIDSFSWIIDTLEKTLRKEILVGFENNIYSNFKNDFNENKINKFLSFIQNTNLSINIEQTPDAQTARERAISKNNTMQVTKGELAISNIQIPIQLLANELLEKSNINVLFPKKEMFIPSKLIKERSIDIEMLVKYISCVHDYLNLGANTKKSSLPLFKLSQSLSGDTKTDHFKLLQKEYIHKVEEDNEDSKEIKNQIKNLESRAEEITGFIKSLNSVSQTSTEIKDLIEKHQTEYDNIKSEVGRFNEKMKNLTDVAYKVRDRKNIVAIIERIFSIRDKVIDQYDKILVKDENKITLVKNFISNKEKFIHYIFVMSFKKNEDILAKIPVADIKELFWQLVTNIETISNTYQTDITAIRNGTDDNTICYKKDKTECTIGEVRDEFFKI